MFDSPDFQGPFATTVAACKVAYTTLLAAKLSGKAVGIYYNDASYTCNTFPAWGEITSMYFLEGPDN
jgi:hypothetical protein